MIAVAPEPTSITDEVEVLVVGAGPAGSSCAARLAEHGHDVLLVDQYGFPREKPCGDGVTDASVQVLENLGLHGLLADSTEIGGVRTFFSRKPKLRQLDRPARCIPRSRLDEGILAAALERGARFAQIRVNGALVDKGTIVGVSTNAVAGGGLHARCVIAADGATSRLRRSCGFAPPPSHRRAYAVRQYVWAEKPLAPYFDLTPLVHRGSELLGYGWVFPLDDHTANVGIGYYRSRALTDPPSLNKVLDDFIHELGLEENARYGDLSRLGRPFGSPLAVNFDVKGCQFQRVLFAGDAAQTTEPVTGEGIGNALHSGAIVAEVAHAALIGAHGPNWHEGLSLGRELDRRFLRIGQDIDVLKRALARRLMTRRDRPAMRRTNPRTEPFFSATAHVIAEPFELPALNRTAVYSLLRAIDPPCAFALVALNEKALDELLTSFPFTPEALHLRLRAEPGPLAASLTLLAARIGGAKPDSTAVSAALGVELLGTFPDFLRQTVDRPIGEGSKFNNIFAILVADYVVSRALRLSASAGAAIAGAVGGTSYSMCEAEMIERVDRGRVGRSPQRYLRAAELREGALFELAVSIGAMLAECDVETTEALARYGREVGVAHRIAADTCALFPSDDRRRDEMERALQEGYLTLPTIGAIAHEGLDLEELGSNPMAFLPTLQRSEGIRIALSECETRTATALEALAGAGLNGAMAQLAKLPVERARSTVITVSN
jgi:menaquinone-9 beta-reductase